MVFEDKNALINTIVTHQFKLTFDCFPLMSAQLDGIRDSKTKVISARGADFQVIPPN